jgi:ethanolamine ammonia-lyase small subunit
MAQDNEHYGRQRTGSADNADSHHIEKFAEKPADGHITDPWQELRSFTRARIALGRVGSSLPTREILNFGLSHALARDAVHLPLDTNALDASIRALGFSTLQVQSKAPNRHTYLLRPDLGRRLNDESRLYLHSIKPKTPIDFMIVVGDGLSSLAIQHHAVPLLTEIHKNIPASWNFGPIVLAQQTRVALADEVGEIMGARMIAILIGERPGLSSPDSLGIYLTYAPSVGCSDAERNCISNVRPEGLPYTVAAHKLIWLAKEAMYRQLSGVSLKDESDVQEVIQVNRGIISD